MISLLFENPKEKYADNAYDGKKYEFDYTFKSISNTPEIDIIKKNKFIIYVPNSLLIKWDFKNSSELYKVLNYKFIFPHIIDKLFMNNLLSIEVLKIIANSSNLNIKFDPNKLKDLINVEIPIDIEQLQKNKNKINLGFN